MQKWQYTRFHIYRDDKAMGWHWAWAETQKKVQDGELDQRLNSLGSQGWELVAVYPVSTIQMGGNAGITSAIYYVLKREMA